MENVGDDITIFGLVASRPKRKILKPRTALYQPIRFLGTGHESIVSIKKLDSAKKSFKWLPDLVFSIDVGPAASSAVVHTEPGIRVQGHSRLALADVAAFGVDALAVGAKI